MNETTAPDVERGRYLAENGRWFVELRVEGGPTGDVSADLRSRDHDGDLALWVKTRTGETWVKTLVPVGATSKESPAPQAEAWVRRADWRDGRGGTASGWITLRRVGCQTIEARFMITQSLSGLVPSFGLTVQAARVSTALRDVGLEIEQESGLDFTLSTTFGEGIVEVKSVLHNAGLDVHDLGEKTVIPSPIGGKWSGSDVFTALNDQMRRISQAPLTSPAWELHLLMLSKTNEPGLLGVMFDFVDDLPRQGAAVFVQEIRERYPEDEVEQRVLSTAIHELGHCLNLTHRFDPEVDRADSKSFMNYDWLYQVSEDQLKRLTAAGAVSVDSSAGYWDRFDYTFDDDELEFLRHAPRDAVIPGGAPFGSVRYWAIPPQREPSVPPPPSNGLQLWLTPPATGTSFAYGLPLFLQVSLRNLGLEPRCVPRHALDVKAGMLDLLIRRRNVASRQTSTESQVFRPVMQRCFAVGGLDRLPLQPGESMHDNVNLAFGSAGSPFMEPGAYVITPRLTLYGGKRGEIRTVVEGVQLQVDVRPPGSHAEERDAELIWRNDVGVSLALGGAACLPEAAGVVRQLVERRQRDRPLGSYPDGMIAAGTRMLGIAASRRNDSVEARRLLNTATLAPQLATFDPHTALHTRMLAAQQPKSSQPTTTKVVIDISARAERNGSASVTAVQSIEGVLISRPPSDDGTLPAAGVAVLFDASDIVSANLASATAVISSPDGITERVQVKRVQSFHDDHESSSRRLGLAVLARTVPCPNGSDVSMDEFGSPRDLRGFRDALRRNGIQLPADVAETGGEAITSADQVGPVAQAERTAPWPGPIPVVSDNVPHTDQVVSRIRDVICKLMNKCKNEAPLPRDPDGPVDDAGPETGCGPSVATVSPRATVSPYYEL
ncbi:MAG TPA: hypothetical protein VIT65_14465 [Microlunatus sp.]